jgi:hypothetical protein
MHNIELRMYFKYWDMVRADMGVTAFAKAIGYRCLMLYCLQCWLQQIDFTKGDWPLQLMTSLFFYISYRKGSLQPRP